jgi:hypothetical protein
MRQSPKPNKEKRSVSDICCDTLGSLLPSCGTALRLVSVGQKRRLKLGEKFVLFYNTPLCLHCNCNRAKFREEREKMRRLKI